MGTLIPRLITVTAAVVFSSCSTLSNSVSYPSAPSSSLRDTMHGHEIADPFRALEDLSSQATTEWIDAENALSAALLDRAADRSRIAGVVSEVLRQDSTGVPMVRGEQAVFTSMRAGDQFPSVHAISQGRERLLRLTDEKGLEPARGVRLLDLSPDGQWLAYSPVGSSDEKSVCFFDLKTDSAGANCLPKSRYFSVALSKDAVYYGRPATGGGALFARPITGAESQETRVFGVDDPEVLLFPGISSDGRFLFISVYHGSAATQTDLYLLDLRNHTPLTEVVKGRGHSDFIDVYPDARGKSVLVLQSDLGSSDHNAVFTVPVESPSTDHWKRIFEAPNGVALDQTIVAGRGLMVGWLEDQHSRLEYIDLESSQSKDVPLPSFGAVTASARGAQSFYFAFSSLAHPHAVYEADVTSLVPRPWHASQESGSEALTVERVTYRSADGTMIPMLLLYKPDTPRDGTAPALVTAYGAFGLSQSAAFSPLGMAWARLGGVYALACVRGGGELGEKWHSAGMLDKKQNTFDDLAAAADYLVSKRYTSRRRLGAWGGSAGGLAVAATVNQHPAAFGAAVVSYPLTDMLRYQLFLAGRFWKSEYGSAEEAAQFETRLRYSPYHNVRKGQRYPPILFITSDSDTRVAPMHALKMAARLQKEASADSGPVLLRVYRDVGHSGSGQSIEQQIRMWTDVITFLRSELR